MSSGSGTIDLSLAKLLIQLQMKRCELAADWRGCFNELLSGAKSAEAYSLYTQQKVVPQAQALSSEFIQIRDDDSAPGAVRKLVSDIQLAEKALFESTLRFQQVSVKHLSCKGLLHEPECDLCRRANAEHYQLKVSTAPTSLSTMEESDDDDEEENPNRAALKRGEDCRTINVQLSELKQSMRDEESKVTELLEELQAVVSDA